MKTQCAALTSLQKQVNEKDLVIVAKEKEIHRLRMRLADRDSLDLVAGNSLLLSVSLILQNNRNPSLQKDDD